MVFLKRFHAEGFKSFATPITLNFNKNMIGIIGPNGSGKSNIVDALKWTIGEQSIKQLRGSERSNLIFMGSEFLPEAKFALVELTFDNSNKVLHTDLTEVKITRKLIKKTEESLFFINDEPAKLKDIHDMFLDTGLSKGSLGIISQGTVSWFADAKPEDRRKIFEEASGIGKYTKKKNESLSLLEKSQNNLNILLEHLEQLKKEVSKLENQAKKVKEYNEKSKQLKLYDLTIKSKEILQYNSEVSVLELKIEKLEIEVNQLSSNIEFLDKSINSKEIEYTSADEKLLNLQTKKDKLVNEINNLINKKTIFDSQLNNDTNSANIEKRIVAYETIIKNNQLELDFIKNELIKDELEFEKVRINKNDKYILLEKTKNIINDFNFQASKISINLDTLKAQRDLGNQDRGTKAIIENKNSLNGIIGLVSDLINIEKKYEIAISTALGATAKNIVTLDEKAALRAVDFLKSNKSGYATFLPVDKIKEKEIKHEFKLVIKQAEGFIGVASELVKINQEYKKVINHLLGNIIIVDDVRDAVLISNLTYNSYKIITLDGDIKHPGGAISGGQKRNINIIFNLDEKIKEQEEELKKLNSLINNKKIEYEKETLEYDNLVLLHNEISIRINNSKYKIEELNKSININKNEYEALTNKSFDMKSNIDVNEIQNELLTKQKELDVIQSEYNQQSSIRQSLFSSLQNQRSEFSENNKIFTTKSSELASDKINLNDYKNKLENIKNFVVSNYKVTIENIIEEYSQKELDIPLSEVKREVIRLRNELDSLGPINQTAIEELEVKQKELNDIQIQYDEVYEIVDKITNTINDLDKKAKSDFKKIIDSVNKDIPIIFKELFGGGNCEINLTNPNDLLETGIEISVQPPGKKISSLMLLSGGEKTLVALCVLFSILKSSNFPMVVLDEAEAALDEYNVEIFAKIIKKYSDNNQFLIITHRPGTMKLCDDLYGVTMQDKGVSMVLKTSFNDIVFKDEVNNG